MTAPSTPSSPTAPETKLRTLSQVRLAGALAAHQRIERLDSNPRSKYRAATQKTPIMIRTIGLGPAIAVLLQQGADGKRLADAIAEWLLGECPHFAEFRVEGKHDGRALLRRIATENKPATYRLAQAEAMAYAQWLKRFADAFIGDA